MRKSVARSILLLAFLLATPAYAQDYKAGLAAFHQGDYAAALEAWRSAAEMGDANR